VYATLLDSGIYLCSVPTMYRVLRSFGEVRERRRQATHPATVKPELVAEMPNRVWSWDIERHEALLNRAVVKGHGRRLVAASQLKLRAA
jgi:putative transposase